MPNTKKISQTEQAVLKDRIRSLRIRSMLSKAAFARKYGIPIRTYEDWESEKKPAPAGYIVTLLECAEGANEE